MSTRKSFFSFFNESNLKKIHELGANISEVYETPEGLNFDVEYSPNLSVLVTLPSETWMRKKVSFGSKVMYPPDSAGVLFILNVLKDTRKEAGAFEKAFDSVNRC